jgi:hypothetical protein
VTAEEHLVRALFMLGGWYKDAHYVTFFSTGV